MPQRFPTAITVASEFDNRRVVYESVDSGNCHHLIWKNLVPFGKGLVGGDNETAGFIAMGNKLNMRRTAFYRYFPPDRIKELRN